MMIDGEGKLFDLNNAEVETLRRAAEARGLPFDAARRTYSAAELTTFGIVRESYHSEELAAFGVRRDKVVTSFDIETTRAREELRIDAPFGSGCVKWQLPIDVCEWRVFITEFDPGTFVEPHVHPANSPEHPGGSMRTVLRGSLTYAGKKFGPGDWFYIPNGIPYAFRSDPNCSTTVMYKYDFFAVTEGNRFSAPEGLAASRMLSLAAA